MTRTWQRMAGAALGVALLAGAGLATVDAREQGPGRGMMGRRGPGGPDGPGGALALPLRGLDLSESQREQVRTALDGHKAEFDAVRSRLQTARGALQAAVTAETFNEAAVRQAAIDVAAVEADGAVLRAKVHSEVWALLTPEQQQKARDLRAQRTERQAQARERLGQRRQQRQQRRQQ
ncbi:MAG: Spy/CpxP family protein refolding chaperone [Vicinamibacterales bacterium]